MPIDLAWWLVVDDPRQQRDQLEKAPISTPSFKAAITAARSSMVVPTNFADFEQEFTSAYLKLGPQERQDATRFDKPDSLINKIMNAHMPKEADKVQYKVLQSIGLGTMSAGESTAILNAPEVPEGMSVKDAVAKFGPGATVKQGGKIRVLPNGQ